MSHFLQRPNKDRLPSEKNIQILYDLCFLGQVITLLVHIVWTVDAAKVTLKHNIISSQPLEVVGYLQYRLQDCTYQTTRAMFGFRDVTITVNWAMVFYVLADLVIQLRVAMFVGTATVILGMVNRGFVEENTFIIARIRNVVVWKSVVSAMELLMLGYVFQIAVAAGTPRSLLKDYFAACNVSGTTTLPHVSLVPLYVFASLGYLTYAVSLPIYLMHTLPKYGTMKPSEAEDFKKRVEHRRQTEQEVSLKIAQTKSLHAALQHRRLLERVVVDHTAAQPGNEGDEDEVLL